MVCCSGAMHSGEGEGKKNPMSSALKTIGSILCATGQGRAPLNPKVPRNSEKEATASSQAASKTKDLDTSEDTSRPAKSQVAGGGVRAHRIMTLLNGGFVLSTSAAYRLYPCPQMSLKHTSYQEVADSSLSM